MDPSGPEPGSGYSDAVQLFKSHLLSKHSLKCEQYQTGGSASSAEAKGKRILRIELDIVIEMQICIMFYLDDIQPVVG